MRQNTKGRQPDVVDVRGETPLALLNSSWLDKDKITIAKSIQNFRSNDKKPHQTTQYTLSRRSGRLRFFYTFKRIGETASPKHVQNVINDLIPATQSLLSGHMFECFVRGDELAWLVQQEMWPFMSYGMREQMNLPSAYRQSDTHEFMRRLVGWTNVKVAEHVNATRVQDNWHAHNILRSMPKPHTQWDYDAIAELITPNYLHNWPAPVPQMRRLSVAHAAQIAERGWPQRNSYFLEKISDLSGYATLQQAVDDHAARHNVVTTSGSSFTYSNSILYNGHLTQSSSNSSISNWTFAP